LGRSLRLPPYHSVYVRTYADLCRALCRHVGLPLNGDLGLDPNHKPYAALNRALFERSLQKWFKRPNRSSFLSLSQFTYRSLFLQPDFAPYLKSLPPKRPLPLVFVICPRSEPTENVDVMPILARSADPVLFQRLATAWSSTHVPRQISTPIASPSVLRHMCPAYGNFRRQPISLVHRPCPADVLRQGPRLAAQSCVLYCLENGQSIWTAGNERLAMGSRRMKLCPRAASPLPSAQATAAHSRESPVPGLWSLITEPGLLTSDNRTP